MMVNPTDCQVSPAVWHRIFVLQGSCEALAPADVPILRIAVGWYDAGELLAKMATALAGRPPYSNSPVSRRTWSAPSWSTAFLIAST